MVKFSVGDMVRVTTLNVIGTIYSYQIVNSFYGEPINLYHVKCNGGKSVYGVEKNIKLLTQEKLEELYG
jgi:hypothetical protein